MKHAYRWVYYVSDPTMGERFVIGAIHGQTRGHGGFLVSPRGRRMALAIRPEAQRLVDHIASTLALRTMFGLSPFDTPPWFGEHVAYGQVEFVPEAQDGADYLDLMMDTPHVPSPDPSVAMPQMAGVPSDPLAHMQQLVTSLFGEGKGRSVEPHGSGWAVYVGREPNMHGYNVLELLYPQDEHEIAFVEHAYEVNEPGRCPRLRVAMAL